MIYQIYYHDKLVSSELSFKNAFDYIKLHNYVIIDDIDHLNEFYTNIYCI